MRVAIAKILHSILFDRHLHHLDASQAADRSGLLILRGSHHYVRVSSDLDLEAVSRVPPDLLRPLELLERVLMRRQVFEGEQLEAISLGLDEEGVRSKHSLD
jgi:hypothetical protein